MMEQQFVQQKFWTNKELKTFEFAQKLTDLLFSRNDEFKPTVFYGQESTKNKHILFSSKDIHLITQALLDDKVNIIKFSNDNLRIRDQVFQLTIYTSRDEGIIEFSVNSKYVESEQNLHKFMVLGRRIAEISNPKYGVVYRPTINNKDLFKVKSIKRNPRAYWGNYYGQETIMKIGKDRLMNSKCYKVKELRNGDIFLQNSENPLIFLK